MQTETPQDKVRKLVEVQHDGWLKLPVSHHAFELISKYEEDFTKVLQSEILVQSDKDREIMLRASIATCKTLKMALFNTAKFVELVTQNKME